MAAKVPLAVRKELRDSWETTIPGHESKLTEILGTPWKIDIDAQAIYRVGGHDSPGYMLNKYLEATTDNLKDFVNKFGEDGKQELNHVATAHTITMDETEDPGISYCGCDIHEGKLRILFAKTYFATNIYQATYPDTLQAALNKAGNSSASLNFNVRSGIKSDWDPKIEDLKKRLQKIIGVDELTITPNFEANFSALDGKPGLDRDWDKALGSRTLTYFEGLADNLVQAGFDKDDMLQEGLQEAFEKKEIKFEVVSKLSKGTYNETLPEDGVLVIRTNPENYNVNTHQVGYGLVDLL
ncbi:hypothetical protein K461DRAFT_293892 [Myriangium duriaei CBS 260.36]|uniref:Uncharacterized protein n=1 Tax=Myriangium duriaei CBS 260.36 TaxID=1168546 RepID=A0A9P4MFC2_9PEZI|nr:hypothetical protein K461DRAFT_293892 [Myriangium duriaei CBS 260.36]